MLHVVTTCFYDYVLFHPISISSLSYKFQIPLFVSDHCLYQSCHHISQINHPQINPYKLLHNINYSIQQSNSLQFLESSFLGIPNDIIQYFRLFLKSVIVPMVGYPSLSEFLLSQVFLFVFFLGQFYLCFSWFLYP